MGEYDSYQDKIILVTGGAGCIGTNLIRGLLQVNVQRIFVIDDLSSASRWNLPNDPRVIFIHGSILNDELLTRAFRERPDIVFHLAAHFANQNSVEHPETDLMVNGLGTLKMLEYCQLIKVEKFVFASSGCSVYGSQAPLPLREDFISLHLDSPYQIHKLLGELYCNFFHNHYGLPVVISRFFNVYGPGEIPGRYRNVIPNFTYWALHKEPLPITGNGEETRDFTFVGDVVEGLLKAAITPEAVGEAMNFASETETAVIDLAKMINEATGNDAGLKYVDRRDWDKISRRKASIEKARRIIGYSPKTDISTGYKKTLSWFVEHRQLIEESAKF